MQGGLNTPLGAAGMMRSGGRCCLAVRGPGRVGLAAVDLARECPAGRLCPYTAG